MRDPLDPKRLLGYLLVMAVAGSLYGLFKFIAWLWHNVF
jgi:hypothetical protein